MAWLWGDTFDHYIEPYQKYDGGAGFVTGQNAVFGRPGGAGCAFADGWLSKRVTPGPGHVGGRICFVTLWVRVFGLQPESWLCSVRPPTTGAIGHNHVAFSVESSGAVSAWAGFTGENYPNTFTGATRVGRTGPGVVRAGEWTLVEMKVLTETGGTIAVRVNQRLELSLSEQPAANPGAQSTWGEVAFGGLRRTDIDMLVICDGVGPRHNTMMGITKAECLRAQSIGAAAVWTTNIEDFQGQNHSMVDDSMGDSDNTTVFTPSPNVIDLYHFPLPSQITSGIVCVQGVTSARVKDRARTIAHQMYSPLTAEPHVLSKNFTVSDPDRFRSQISVWPTEPQTGEPWTPGLVDLLQFGQRTQD